LEKQYDLIALRIPELGCEMLKLISGNDRAKHTALWEGPFEYYVWLAAIGIFPRQSCVRGRRTFAGVNCFCLNRQAYSRPFTIARLEHHRRQHAELGAWVAVLNEEARVLAGKLQRRFQRAARKLV
jgi:hypothetical protein